MADEERLRTGRWSQIQLPREADAALERRHRLRGVDGGTARTARLHLELLRRGGGQRHEDGRHLDLDARSGRNPRSDGTIRLPAGRFRRLCRRQRWMASDRRGPGTRGGRIEVASPAHVPPTPPTALDPERSSDRLSAWVAAGLFAVTAALLLLEVSLTRVLSVVMWYHFAFFAISVALF